MSTYIPHTELDVAEMLATIGVKDLNTLFKHVPTALRQKAHIKDIPVDTEFSLLTDVLNKLHGNTKVSHNFLGAGRYRHYIPSVVRHLAGRSEFYTAYTPYQPEISQGTLTAIFEYQSMICELTGMDIANASMYDGASAAAEAALLAIGFTGRKEVVIVNEIHPNTLEVIKTYTAPREVTVTTAGVPTEATAAVIVSFPSFIGRLDDYLPIIAEAKAVGALVIVVVDPHVLALCEAPGVLGADIVVGEGQPLGIGMSFGGPGLGFFAVKNQYLRHMPGRIVGQTIDRDGTPCYVLTMQTREQHIRREKATSNICSNQALCALMATIYISTMGAKGLATVAQLSKQKADQLKKAIGAIPGFVVDMAETFKEFVVTTPVAAHTIIETLLPKGILAGHDLGNNKLLVCCTEITTDEDIAVLIKELAQWKK